VSGQTELNSFQETGSMEPAPARRARLLLVEDDASVSALLKERFESERYPVTISAEGAGVLAQIDAHKCDLVILDLGLPRVDGLDLLRRIRSRDSALPVLVLTGRTQVDDRVKALDLGADDYLTKPFEYPELAARVRALLRRAQHSEEAVTHFEDLELNRMDRTVRRAERQINLTPKEFALLEYLMMNPGRCLTRAMIMEHVWKSSFTDETNVVDVYINYLRNKIDKGFPRKLICTVRGAGYRLGGSSSATESLPASVAN
jgi:DNA-binding response OmpR family regulator